MGDMPMGATDENIFPAIEITEAKLIMPALSMTALLMRFPILS